eukprot:1693409-Alexandrium_andersonii.AAC.2
MVVEVVVVVVPQDSHEGSAMTGVQHKKGRPGRAPPPRQGSAGDRLLRCLRCQPWAAHTRRPPELCVWGEPGVIGAIGPFCP